MGSAKTAMKSSLVDAEKFLEQLTTLGKMHDATGEVEDVAGGLTELMESTLQTAQSEGADGDYYEAHAVLLNLKRKQMDSGWRHARDRPRDERRRAAEGGDGVPEGPEVERRDADRRAGHVRRQDRYAA